MTKKTCRTFTAAFLLSIIAGSTSIHAKEIKLLSLNVWQFPYGIVSKNNKGRANKLAQTIRQHHQEFDVLAFQEFWSNQTRGYFYKKIRDLYPYKYEDKQLGFLLVGFHSGLAIYSKYPITRKMVSAFSQHRGVDNFTKKGVLGVELEVDRNPVFVFTTHMQAGSGGPFFEELGRCKPSNAKISLSQVRESIQAIQKFTQGKDAPIFFLGDFNTTAGTEKYYEVLALLDNGVDSFAAEKSKYQGTSWKNLGKRIDYIFTLGKPVLGYSHITDYFGSDVTDHLGVMGSFEMGY